MVWNVLTLNFNLKVAIRNILNMCIKTVIGNTYSLQIPFLSLLLCVLQVNASGTFVMYVVFKIFIFTKN